MMEIGHVLTRTHDAFQKWDVDIIGDEVRIWCSEEKASGLYADGFHINPDAIDEICELLQHAKSLALQLRQVKERAA